MDCRSDLVWQFLCSCVLPPPGARAKLSGIMRKSLFRSPGKNADLAIKNHLLKNSEDFASFIDKMYIIYTEIVPVLSLFVIEQYYYR